MDHCALESLSRVFASAGKRQKLGYTSLSLCHSFGLFLLSSHFFAFTFGKVPRRPERSSNTNESADIRDVSAILLQDKFVFRGSPPSFIELQLLEAEEKLF